MAQSGKVHLKLSLEWPHPIFSFQSDSSTSPLRPERGDVNRINCSNFGWGEARNETMDRSSCDNIKCTLRKGHRKYNR
jgi:hypothetical protein